jgi:hypothetical protein
MLISALPAAAQPLPQPPRGQLQQPLPPPVISGGAAAATAAHHTPSPQQQPSAAISSPVPAAPSAHASSQSSSGGIFGFFRGTSTSNNARTADDDQASEASNPLLNSDRETLSGGVELHSMVASSRQAPDSNSGSGVSTQNSEIYVDRGIAEDEVSYGYEQTAARVLPPAPPQQPQAATGTVPLGSVVAVSALSAAAATTGSSPMMMHPTGASTASPTPSHPPVVRAHSVTSPAATGTFPRFPGYDAGRDTLMAYFATVEGINFLSSAPKLVPAQQLMAYGVLKSILHRYPLFSHKIFFECLLVNAEL